MPRQARLDIPGAIHHVMGRGIEKQSIFHCEADRKYFLDRLEILAQEKALVVYAWALMSNHFHLLVRSTQRPISFAMRSLMSSYAGYFNRQHRRVGHLFQNRFKSILCEEDAYMLELVRYIHLNPLRTGLVKTLRELDQSSLTGHSVLMGRVNRVWQQTEEILAMFSRSVSGARNAYRAFIKEGLERPAPTNLEGGGLIRSHGGWGSVRTLRKGREKFLSNERILGGSEFVENMINEAEKLEQRRQEWIKRMSVQSLTKIVCDQMSIDPGALGGGGRSQNVSLAREALAYLWVIRMGLNGRELTRNVGMRPETVYSSARRGRKRSGRWERLLELV